MAVESSHRTVKVPEADPRESCRSVVELRERRAARLVGHSPQESLAADQPPPASQTPWVSGRAPRTLPRARHPVPTHSLSPGPTPAHSKGRRRLPPWTPARYAR